MSIPKHTILLFLVMKDFNRILIWIYKIYNILSKLKS